LGHIENYYTSCRCALFRQYGITQCADLDEWIETIEIFRSARAPSARGIGLIGVSGAENALVLDHVAELELSVPPLSTSARRRLARILPAFARLENPIDPSGLAVEDPSLYRQCLQVLADEEELGIIAVSQDCPAAFDLAAAKATAETARQSDKCFVYFNNFSGPFRPEVQRTLREAGVPYLQGLKESIRAIKALIAHHLKTPRPALTPVPIDRLHRERARAELAATERVITECSAKRLIAGYGLPVVGEELAHDAAEGNARRQGLAIQRSPRSPLPMSSTRRKPEGYGWGCGRRGRSRTHSRRSRQP
jgi:acyl-CoA synthetase (NDP forming)